MRGDSLAENKVTFGCELAAVVVVMDTEAAKGHVMLVFVGEPTQPNLSGLYAADDFL